MVFFRLATIQVCFHGFSWYSHSLIPYQDFFFRCVMMQIHGCDFLSLSESTFQIFPLYDFVPLCKQAHPTLALHNYLIPAITALSSSYFCTFPVFNFSSLHSGHIPSLFSSLSISSASSTSRPQNHIYSTLPISLILRYTSSLSFLQEASALCISSIEKWVVNL